MDSSVIKEKYDNLTNRGMLPLVFKRIEIEDPGSNPELIVRNQFASPKFNTRLMNFQYVERSFNV